MVPDEPPFVDARSGPIGPVPCGDDTLACGCDINEARAAGDTWNRRGTKVMATVSEAAADFLAQKRIAVAGVSRNKAGHGGNVVYARLKQRGYEVFAVNPNAETVEGDTCYRDLASIPGGVDAVVIATNPSATDAVVADCVSLGIKRVWMHRSFGGGSVSDSGVAAGRMAGLTVIAGACPLMFDPTADGAHKCMRWVLGFTKAKPTAG